MAASLWARMRPEIAAGAASSRPAVSISVTWWPPSDASPSRRSRVSPGISDTRAVRLAVRRLNRVDLPTLGRPTMATTGGMHGSHDMNGQWCATPGPSRLAARTAAPLNGAASLERVEPRVVAQHVEAAPGDHRCNEDRVADAVGGGDLAAARFHADQLPLGGGEPQPAAGQNRPSPGAGPQLGCPANPAVGARHGGELAGGIHHKHGVAGHPGLLDAGDRDGPDALPRLRRRGDQAPAVAGSIPPPAVEHRPRRIAHGTKGRA